MEAVKRHSHFDPLNFWEFRSLLCFLFALWQAATRQQRDHARVKWMEESCCWLSSINNTLQKKKTNLSSVSSLIINFSFFISRLFVDFFSLAAVSFSLVPLCWRIHVPEPGVKCRESCCVVDSVGIAVWQRKWGREGSRWRRREREFSSTFFT